MGFIDMLWDTFAGFFRDTGFIWLDYKSLIMIAISLILMYLAIKKDYEPLLLLPISFGMLLVNLPLNGLMDEGGLLYYLYKGDELGIFPPLIFMGIGAMTDFGPLIANPKSILLGGAAQFGIFMAFLGALALNLFPGEIFQFTEKMAASIGIIGGADGPTAIFLATKLAPELLGPIAVAAYSYMSLVPIIQPPIMRALTTKEERAVKMEMLRPVSQREKILFPIIVTILVNLTVPSAASLVGMLMLGNLFRESGVTGRLADTASGPLLYITTIMIGVTVGATTSAESFLNPSTIGILLLGLVAFAFGTAGGVVMGKIMCKLTGGKVNPLIGAAGVSAVPMAARVAHKVGQEENPDNYLLMHAMGPNVAGAIGTAIAAGVFLKIYGGI